jgi:hypothetical protein
MVLGRETIEMHLLEETRDCAVLDFKLWSKTMDSCSRADNYFAFNGQPALFVLSSLIRKLSLLENDKFPLCGTKRTTHILNVFKFLVAKRVLLKNVAFYNGCITKLCLHKSTYESYV